MAERTVARSFRRSDRVSSNMKADPRVTAPSGEREAKLDLDETGHLV